MDSTALFKIGYGLYVLTAREGDYDNGCIINTLMQITSAEPFYVIVTVNKQNKTHDMIMRTKKFNVSMLTTKVPFDVFVHFGFQSGSKINKFTACPVTNKRSPNGLIYLADYANAYVSAEVTSTMDCGSHTIFYAKLTEAVNLCTEESLTYAYYHKNVKPQPQTKKVGYVCKICGYEYAGDTLPADFICPLCKHGAADFEKIS